MVGGDQTRNICQNEGKQGGSYQKFHCRFKGKPVLSGIAKMQSYQSGKHRQKESRESEASSHEKPRNLQPQPGPQVGRKCLHIAPIEYAVVALPGEKIGKATNQHI